MPTTLPKHKALTRLNTVQAGKGTTSSGRTAEPVSRLNTVQARMAKVHADSREPLIDVNRPEILSLIRQALADVGLKQEAAAAIAGVKPSQFSAALNGQGNFGATWIWAQDDRFLLRLLELVMDARHLTPASARALRMKRIVELVELLLTECA